jgi:hypothetical protein
MGNGYRVSEIGETWHRPEGAHPWRRTIADVRLGAQPARDEESTTTVGNLALYAHWHANQGWHRIICGGGSPVVLGVPLGTGPAHVMQLRPVAIEQASGQVLNEVGEIGGQAVLAAGGEPSS